MVIYIYNLVHLFHINEILAVKKKKKYTIWWLHKSAYIGMDGYHFFLISGYLDILDTDFFWILIISMISGYLDIMDIQ